MLSLHLRTYQRYGYVYGHRLRAVLFTSFSLGLLLAVGLLLAEKSTRTVKWAFTRDIDDPISLKEGKLDPRISKIETNHFSLAVQQSMPQLVFVVTTLDEVMSHTFLM